MKIFDFKSLTYGDSFRFDTRLIVYCFIDPFSNGAIEKYTIDINDESDEYVEFFENRVATWVQQILKHHNATCNFEKFCNMLNHYLAPVGATMNRNHITRHKTYDRKLSVIIEHMDQCIWKENG